MHIEEEQSVYEGDEDVEQKRKHKESVLEYNKEKKDG